MLTGVNKCVLFQCARCVNCFFVWKIWPYHTEYAVYPKKYAQGFCFAVLCCGYTLTDSPISTRLTSLALWQSNDCPSASKATLMNMDKYFICDFIMNDCITTTKQSTTKPCAYFLGYTVDVPTEHVVKIITMTKKRNVGINQEDLAWHATLGRIVSSRSYCLCRNYSCKSLGTYHCPAARRKTAWRAALYIDHTGQMAAAKHMWAYADI